MIERQQAHIVAQQAEIGRLMVRIEELEVEVATLRGSAGSGGAGVQRPTRPARPPRKTGPRRKRPHAFVRTRGIATQQVTHALDQCPDCGCPLRGGSVKRHREVIEIALAPATITDHLLVERVCPMCQKRCVPRLGPCDGVVGQHRFGPRLLALIVTLHQVGRMTVRPIQEHLATVFGVHVSLGAIEDALRTTATRGGAEVEAIRDQIRASSVAHADETSWPENGASRTFWVVSARRFRYFEIGRRTNEQIDGILGADFAGILVTDFYAAYHHFGLHQRCWAHIVRELHDLLTTFPKDRLLAGWVRRLLHIYRAARDAPACTTTDQRRRLRRHLEQRLQAACLPFAACDVPQRRLSARLVKHLAELFTFVTEPDVPSTNNQAERDLRPSVIARKVSGGTRSPDGSTTIARLATLVRTWRAHDLNPFLQCVNLLSAPQA